MTYQLHLQLGDDLERDLRVFAADNGGLTIAAATRLLVLQGLKAEAALAIAQEGSSHRQVDRMVHALPEAKKNEEDKP